MYLQLVDCAHFILLAFRWLPVQTHRPPPFYIYLFFFASTPKNRQKKPTNAVSPVMGRRKRGLRRRSWWGGRITGSMEVVGWGVEPRRCKKRTRVEPPNKQTNYEPIYKLPKPTEEEISDSGVVRGRSTVNHRDRHSVWQTISDVSRMVMLPALQERLGPRPLLFCWPEAIDQVTSFQNLFRINQSTCHELRILFPFQFKNWAWKGILP